MSASVENGKTWKLPGKALSVCLNLQTNHSHLHPQKCTDPWPPTSWISLSCDCALLMLFFRIILDLTNTKITVVLVLLFLKNKKIYALHLTTAVTCKSLWGFFICVYVTLFIVWCIMTRSTQRVFNGLIGALCNVMKSLYEYLSCIFMHLEHLCAVLGPWNTRHHSLVLFFMWCVMARRH